jgi:hypothetical protein
MRLIDPLTCRSDWKHACTRLLKQLGLVLNHDDSHHREYRVQPHSTAMSSGDIFLETGCETGMLAACRRLVRCGATIALDR